jgi:hypothetical protein
MAANLDRETARALVDAGYMPLHRYIELYGSSNVAVDPLAGDRSDWRRPQAGRSPAPGGSSHRRKQKTHKAA